MKFWVDHPFYVKSTEGLLQSYVLVWGSTTAWMSSLPDTDTGDLRAWKPLSRAALPDVLLFNLSWLPKMRKAKSPLDVPELVKELNGNMGGFFGRTRLSDHGDGKHIPCPSWPPRRCSTSARTFSMRRDLRCPIRRKMS